MKIAILSDAHGNYGAFLHSLELIRSFNVDEIYFLGDAVGYMPDGEKVVSMLAQNNVHCIKGNHEAMMLGMLSYSQERENIYRLKETKRRMRPCLLQYMTNWPMRIEIKMDEKNILFLHGGVDNPILQYVYPDSNLDWIAKTPHDAIFMGHTHHPFQQRLESKLVVNVGSCGLPRDQGNLISFAIYDSQTNQCQIVRSYIDVENIVNQYNDIHMSVKECLYRQKNKKEIVGIII